MAVSAFKSTSKRGNFATPATGSSSTKETNTEDPKKKSQHRRRSRSVSAASRTHFDSSSSRVPLNISEFSDKRDNPLFSSSSPSPPGGCKSEKSIGFGEFDRGSRQKPTGADVSDGRRGRVASRNSGSGGGIKFSGRSLSRVDTGRHRQSFLNSESEIEDGNVLGLTRRNKMLDYKLGRWICGFFSEMEEQTIEHFLSERRKIHDSDDANHRKNSAVDNLANITDARPEFVDPDAIEFISDVQSEYAAKFEQSQDRARKLRADLAVEEQREQELSRILKQMLPDPRNSESQKPHIKRKDLDNQSQYSLSHESYDASASTKSSTIKKLIK
ncbi:hypothetical protein QJS10_CPB04g00581 [Acorus calamus]|uniref:Uncharacterized protein n=1 Tax=Acorus calamus TaxID=4465 RepID=A0AAV9F1B5_ACOCL|nr:hypothetical protein QJS10_CPB04g00581 [Acorus calamus]